MGVMIALLLVLSTLSACTEAPITEVKSAPSTLAERPAVICYTAETETFTDKAVDADGTLLATCRYEVPVLRAFREDGTEITESQTPAEEAALTTVSSFCETFSDWSAAGNFQKLSDYAREDLSWRRENGWTWAEDQAYTEELDCTVYQTGDLVSIAATYSSYTGGAHPNTVLLSWNFDLTTGSFLSPEALGADGQEFSAMVQAEIIRQAQERAAEAGVAATDMFWENYAEIAGDWRNFAVTFDKTGMTVGYSPYEMACYAAGAQVFTLPYEQLQPYLSAHGAELLGLSEP